VADSRALEKVHALWAALSQRHPLDTVRLQSFLSPFAAFASCRSTDLVGSALHFIPTSGIVPLLQLQREPFSLVHCSPVWCFGVSEYFTLLQCLAVCSAGRVAVWNRLSGVHSGARWMGAEPTGRKFTVNCPCFYTFDESGRIGWLMVLIIFYFLLLSPSFTFLQLSISYRNAYSPS